MQLIFFLITSLNSLQLHANPQSLLKGGVSRNIPESPYPDPPSINPKMQNFVKIPADFFGKQMKVNNGFDCTESCQYEFYNFQRKYFSKYDDHYKEGDIITCARNGDPKYSDTCFLYHCKKDKKQSLQFDFENSVTNGSKFWQREVKPYRWIGGKQLYNLSDSDANLFQCAGGTQLGTIVPKDTRDHSNSFTPQYDGQTIFQQRVELVAREKQDKLQRKQDKLQSKLDKLQRKQDELGAKRPF